MRGSLLLFLALGACAAKPSPPAPIPVEQGKVPETVQAPAETVGKASIYSDSLQGRAMASGKRYDREAPVAASKTLPIGTVAKVTNLENGKSTIVKVQDRGPVPKGRVVDLSRAAAKEIGLNDGVARVAVQPMGTER